MWIEMASVPPSRPSLLLLLILLPLLVVAVVVADLRPSRSQKKRTAVVSCGSLGRWCCSGRGGTVVTMPAPPAPVPARLSTPLSLLVSSVLLER